MLSQEEIDTRIQKGTFNPADLINDPIKKRRQQLKAYYVKQMAENNVSIEINPKEMFEEAILIIEQTILCDPATESNTPMQQSLDFLAAKNKLLLALENLKQQTLKDFESGLLTQNDADIISVHTIDLVITGDVDTFIKKTNQSIRVKNTPIWQRLIALVVGAIVGFLIVTATCPGAALTALAGGATGALAGIGLVTFFKKQQPHPLADVASSAKEIFKDGVTSLKLCL